MIAKLMHEPPICRSIFVDILVQNFISLHRVAAFDSLLRCGVPPGADVTYM